MESIHRHRQRGREREVAVELVGFTPFSLIVWVAQMSSVGSLDKEDKSSQQGRNIYIYRARLLKSVT